MTQLIVPTADLIVKLNQLVCIKEGHSHHCFDKGKIESALHSAFYPGTYPFQAGGIAKIAGALCFYLINTHAFVDGNKRTAALVALTFMKQNGWSIQYPQKKDSGVNEFSHIIEKCASGQVTKSELIQWFENHKIKR